LDRLLARIRDVHDFPKPGILFKDITPLMADPETFRLAIDSMADPIRKLGITKVVGVESRGFIFAAALAYALSSGLVIVRKRGKLPYRTTKVEYALEYGIDTLEMHVDSLGPNDHCVIVDDILATGGTARAAIELVETSGAHVEVLTFLSEISFLKGREKLGAYKINTLMSF
jgi:adenine phosphoribosyltransferase